jgi:UDP-N-acetylmuramate--alanine ligase
LNPTICEEQLDWRMSARGARRVHLVGVAGAGMRSLADLLDQAGWQVSGSDLAGLAGAPFEVHQGHDADRIAPALDLVIHSDAVPAENPERIRASELGVRSLSYAQMLGQLMETRRGVAVAGTHGKSTTTAMTGEILLAAGLSPSVVVGAAPIGALAGGRRGNGDWLVVEACEYHGNFQHLVPELAAILNVEPDHFDCYASQSELEQAFWHFARRVPSSGLIVARHECPATMRVVSELCCAVETFGESAAATWRATEIRERRGYYRFHLNYRDRPVCEVNLPVPGMHNVWNAVAAAALASHSGASGESIRRGLEGFVGLRRRLQLLGEVRNVALVDDYAHHPTEVVASLTALRQMYPGRRIVCAFQPHQASRLARLLDDFALSLHNADIVIVADVYRAREDAEAAEFAGADALCQRLGENGCHALRASTNREILQTLKQRLLPGDVFVAMGAGDIGTVAHELGQGLRTIRQTV